MYIDKIQVDGSLYDVKDTSSGYITKAVNDLTNYELKTNTGTNISLSVDSSTYVITMQLKNSNGDVLSTGTVDLPLETMVVGASYDSVNKSIILTLQNGHTVSFSVADLVSGLESNSNKVTTISSASTNTQYPSAKAVYDYIQSLNGNGVSY